MKMQPRQCGFSLVELMVAMLIGLFLVGGIVYVYVGSKTSYNFNVATATIQENGRFAIHFLVRDVRQAGYSSCAQSIGNIDSTLKPNTNDYLWDFGAGLDGYDNIDASNVPAALSNVLGTQIPIDDTDAITLRGATANDVSLVSSVNTSSASLFVSPDANFQDGDILIITDCTNATIFQATQTNTQNGGGGPKLVVVHNTGSGTPGNSTKDLGHNYGGGDSHVLSMQTTVYYVAKSTYGQVPSLWRETTNNSSAQELVPGVENMQILYGEDTDGNRRADQYVDAASVSDMDDVVSVRIALLMTSLEEVAAEPVPYSFNGVAYSNPGDNHIRREFTATVNLRNRSP